jgi:hypothetical protein
MQEILMKQLAPAAALICLAAPALAHPGTHFNPHGGEIALAMIVALGAIAAAAFLSFTKARAKQAVRK